MRFQGAILTALSAVLITAGQAYPAERRNQAAKNSRESILLPDTDLVDQPTAGILDYYGFLARTRFFSGGGVMGSMGFGVLQRLNLGVSMNADQLIGTASPVKLVRPEIQVKFRFYDGGQHLPALALGYDGQGYFYDRGLKKYMEKSRGVYLVGSQEIGVPGLLLHPGFNVSDFDSNSIFGFFGANYTIEDSVSLMAEWDNINTLRGSRFNSGLRIYVTPFFHLDLSVRDIGRSGTFENGLQVKPERIVQLRYNSNF